MNRAVYLGGFGNGRLSSEGVAGALENYFGEVDDFTFSDAVNHPDRIRKAVRNVPVFAHSAGMMALKDTWPKAIHAFDAPLPTSRGRLLARTLIKTARMHTPGLGMHSLADGPAVIKYGASSVSELVIHPVANLKPFLNGQISRFDGVQAGISARGIGIPTTMAYMDSDAYFQLSDDGQWQAERAGVGIVRMPGEHDELVLRPAQTLKTYMAKT